MLSRKAFALAALPIPIVLAGCAAPSPPRTVITLPAAAPPPLAATIPAPVAPLPSLQPIYAPGAINPDVTQTNIGVTICAPGWTATVRPPVSYTNRLKLEQMSLYGYPAGTDPRSVEEDHREPLQIGGAPRDPRNLWPETLDAARAKDRLESAVKRDVCAGRLTLQQGQAIFLGDFWYEYDRRASSLSPKRHVRHALTATPRL